ncbi:MAG: Uma2 family endonuclease [Planctomycetales bacterium]|nr:Uma2 family endonuclease [Planctomycetales bacterium]
MSAAIKFAPHYTIEDYRLWEGKWELWSGIAIAMTPSPFGRHQALLASLLTAFRVGIEQQNCRATALAELDWIVSDDTVVRPDMIVVCGGAPDRYLESPPALIAEVLSSSTRQNDLTYKRELYASQGVQTYLIADPENKSIQQLTLSASGGYESIDAPARLRLVLCGDCKIDIDSAKLFLD